jgi:hypothetical protein
MKTTERQANKAIRDVEDELALQNKKEPKMKDTITVNKLKYNTMKYALYTLVIVGLVFVGRNWGYSDHQLEVNKITAQLKTQQ